MAAEPTDEAWLVFSGLYRILLHLAGRMPDDWMIEARAWLGRGELGYMPDLISGGAAGIGVALPAEDLDLLRRLQAQYGGPEAPAGIDLIPVLDRFPPTEHRFTPGPGPDALDDSAVLVNLDPVVVAIARAWRTGADGDPPTRVFLVEVDPVAEALTVGNDLARLLDWSPERPVPQIEVYWSGEPLPPYHTAALAAAAPLWRRQGGPDRSGRGPIQAAPGPGWADGGLILAPGPGWADRGPTLVRHLVEAALRRDFDVMRRTIDWPLTGAPRVASRLAELPPAELDDWAGDLIPRLFTAGDTVEGVLRVLWQVVDLIGDNPRSYRPDDVEAGEILESLRIPPVPGLAEPLAARLAELSRRAESLSEVFLVHGGPTWLPLIWASDTDRLVLVYE
jgi:hypothetical protein